MKVETHGTENDWLKPDHAHDQTTWGDELRAENARLQAERDAAIQSRDAWLVELTAYKAENERLRAALAFYADPKHYADPPYGGLNDIEADGGQVARETLGE